MSLHNFVFVIETQDNKKILVINPEAFQIL